MRAESAFLDSGEEGHSRNMHWRRELTRRILAAPVVGRVYQPKQTRCPCKRKVECQQRVWETGLLLCEGYVEVEIAGTVVRI